MSVDLMDSYPKTNTSKMTILVFSETFTKWVEAFHIRDSKTSTIVRLLEVQAFSHYGYPKTILTDNGR